MGESGYFSRPLLWLNLLCLGAPLVAVSWQWLFGRAFHVDVPTAERAALFLAVWLIYLIDRLTGAISSELAGKVREDFSLKHRRAWFALIGVVTTAAVITAIMGLNRVVFIGGVIVGGIVIVYTIINLVFGRLWRTIPIKEAVVGGLFAIGTTLSIWMRLSDFSPQFVFALFLFACLCSLNSMSIAFWERDLDLARGFESIATGHPNSVKVIHFSGLGLALMCLVLPMRDRSLLWLALCLLVSFLCLFALLAVPVVRRDERTALADLVLLTPIVSVLFNRLL